MLVALVDVAACGIGLPDLDELPAYGPTLAVEHATGDLSRSPTGSPPRWIVRSASSGPTSRSPNTGLHSSIPSGSTWTGLLVG